MSMQWCRCCKKVTEWKEGVGLLNTMVMGIPDFPGNTVRSRGQTVHFGGQGILVDVDKCTECGASYCIPDVILKHTTGG